MTPISPESQRGGAAWWSVPVAALADELHATAAGLNGSEARIRLERYGRNELRDGTERSALVEFRRRFRNPLVLILLAASLISAFTGEVASFVIIIVMVLASVILDFAQEYRADRAAKRLRQSVQIRANAVRDGVTTDVPVAKVVPGDVVLLSAGSLVPADGRLLEARDLFVNQALLTGESFPVEKHADDIAPASAELHAATNALFMGSSIVSGTARMLVCRTGNATAIGAIARARGVAAPPTAFELGVRRFGMLIMRLTVLMVLFVLMVNTLTPSRRWNRSCSRSRLPWGSRPNCCPW